MRTNRPTNPVNPGVETLEKAWPWMTPDAVEFLSDLYLRNAVMAEIGSGGSTVFFAQRCKKVYSFEQNADWAGMVEETVKKKRLGTKVQIYKQDFDDPGLVQESITILCPDSSKRCTNWNRTAILERWLPKLEDESLIILDNYAWDKVWPGLSDLSALEFLDKYNLKSHKVIDFDFDGWMGNGTRIVIHEDMV